jgi:hypothetical protein
MSILMPGLRKARELGKQAYLLADPDEASYWRELQEGNEDIDKLVRSIWGKVGWE